ncbi:hypothetical protein FRX31_019456 [Thalictrum thalictroides]|uniref:Uncharacterized protein n=1 Tax=Thalictrum thalictroides TaxID=46969 RepID=A0A7J6W1X7_THATH|nr:hypothetical protein FRX31_019456 [Thalictrum thalictroides]
MMAFTGSLQVSHDLGVYKYHGSTKQFKNMVGKGRLHLWKVSFSSHGSLTCGVRDGGGVASNVLFLISRQHTRNVKGRELN